MYYIIVISQLILVVQQIFEEHKTSEDEFYEDEWAPICLMKIGFFTIRENGMTKMSV